jgi:hypothetical protein
VSGRKWRNRSKLILETQVDRRKRLSHLDAPGFVFLWGRRFRLPTARRALLLSGHLLLALVPGADLQTAADPAQRFVPRIGSLGAADRALRSLRQAIRGNGTLSLLQQFLGDHRLELWLRFPSHVHYQSHYGRKRASAQPTLVLVRTGLVQCGARNAPCPLRADGSVERPFRLPRRRPCRRSSGMPVGIPAWPAKRLRYGALGKACRLHSRPLRGFRNLHHHGDIQRRRAPRTSLAGRHARIPALQVDVRLHRMGADRTMDLPLNVILTECLHGFFLTPSDAKLAARVVSKS